MFKPASEDEWSDLARAIRGLAAANGPSFRILVGRIQGARDALDAQNRLVGMENKVSGAKVLTEVLECVADALGGAGTKQEQSAVTVAGEG